MANMSLDPKHILTPINSNVFPRAIELTSWNISFLAYKMRRTPTA